IIRHTRFSRDWSSDVCSSDLWAERDLQSLRSRLTLGDTFTDSSVFDSMQMRGVQLRSDDEMLPYSQRSYAPVVRGVAASNARVEVGRASCRGRSGVEVEGGWV